MQSFRNYTKYMTGESTRPPRPYLIAASLIRRIPLRRRRWWGAANTGSWGRRSINPKLWGHNPWSIVSWGKRSVGPEVASPEVVGQEVSGHWGNSPGAGGRWA